MLYDHCTRVTHVLHVCQIACSNALTHAYHRDQLLEMSGYCPTVLTYGGGSSYHIYLASHI